MEENRLIEIDVKRILRSLLKNMKWIVMSGLLFLAVGIVVSLLTQDKQDVYTTSASVYSITETGYYTDTYDGTMIMMMYAEMGTSPTVLERANRIMGNRYSDINDIADFITIEHSTGTVLETGILKVWATGTDQSEIVEVANAVADAFVIEMSNIMEDGEVRIMDYAQFAELKIQAQKSIILLTALIALGGIGLTCVIIVLMEIFSTKLITVKDGTLYGKLSIIGVIPHYEEVAEDGKHRITVGEGKEV